MPKIVFATLLIAIISGMIAFARQLKILQKNKYLLSGYFKWLKESYTTEFALSAILYCGITITIMKEMEIIALVLASLLLVVRTFLSVSAKKNQETKLGFTARVKRLYMIAIVLLGVAVLISAISSNLVVNEIGRMVCLILSIVAPVLTVITWCVEYPIEKAIRSKKQKVAKDTDAE